MKKSYLIATAVLLSTTGVGVALAATEFHGSVERVVSELRADGDARASNDGRFRVADDHHRDRDRRHGAERRRHHDDDEDDDDDGARGPSVPVTGPTDPNAPVPDNGLFNGKARPQVQVN